MAYKFQLGSATLSGSTTFEEDVTVASLDASNGGITQAGAIAGATTITATGVVSSSADGRFLALDINGTEAISSARAGDLSSLALNSGGITAAGSIAGATTISGSSTITGGAFTTDGAVTGGSLTDGSATLTAGGLTLAGALGGATTISGSGQISGASLQVGGNSVISDFEGTGLSVTAGTLNAATDVIATTGHGITVNTQLSGGFNYSNASPQTTNITRILPASAGVAVGQIYYVKAGNLGGNTLFVSASGGDLVDQQGQISIESDGGAVGVIYVGGGNFNIF
jgi:hypothetical protein